MIDTNVVNTLQTHAVIRGLSFRYWQQGQPP